MRANNKNNIILRSIGETEKAVKAASEVPAGYVEIRLSTKGRVGAPEIFHIRNFKVSDIITLSMSSRIELPARLIKILNEMIWEDVDVSKWHEKEVEELMVMIFLTFYKGVLTDMPFLADEYDFEYLEKQQGGKEKAEALRKGEWVPRVDINIAKDVDTYDVPDDYSPIVTITNKKTGFKVVFDYIKYGDQIVIRNWLDSYFAEDEARFAKIKKQIDINNDLSRQFLDDPTALDRYIEVDKDEENEYKEYLIRRTQVITDVANIVSIIEIDGEDISNLSVGEKYERFGGDARIDYGLISRLSKVQAKTPIGIRNEVKMNDPITGEVVKRPFSFRIPLIIQALQLSGDDDNDDCYDVET